MIRIVKEDNKIEKAVNGILLELGNLEYLKNLRFTEEDWLSIIPALHKMELKYLIRHNYNFSLEVLYYLYDTFYAQERKYLSKQINLNDDLIEKLAEDKDLEVRAFIALHPKTGRGILEKLSNDVTKVKVNLANRKELPINILKEFLKIKEEKIQNIAIKNLYRSYLEIEDQIEERNIDSKEKLLALYEDKKSINLPLELDLYLLDLIYKKEFFHIFTLKAKDEIWLDLLKEHPEAKWLLVKNKYLNLNLLEILIGQNKDDKNFIDEIVTSVKYIKLNKEVINLIKELTINDLVENNTFHEFIKENVYLDLEDLKIFSSGNSMMKLAVIDVIGLKFARMGGEILSSLANDQNRKVREAIFFHRDISDNTKERLCYDEAFATKRNLKIVNKFLLKPLEVEGLKLKYISKRFGEIYDIGNNRYIIRNKAPLYRGVYWKEYRREEDRLEFVADLDKKFLPLVTYKAVMDEPVLDYEGVLES